jgi:large subunit ribosomal protein L16
MQQPNHPKYRKAFKGRIGRGRYRKERSFGEWGLRSIEGARVSARQLEAARRSLRRSLQRQGTVWSRQYPAIPVSGKPSEVRRGKGKGGVAFWACRVRPGAWIFEVGGVEAYIAKEALTKAAKKLPRHCRIEKRRIGLA